MINWWILTVHLILSSCNQKAITLKYFLLSQTSHDRRKLPSPTALAKISIRYQHGKARPPNTTIISMANWSHRNKKNLRWEWIQEKPIPHEVHSIRLHIGSDWFSHLVIKRNDNNDYRFIHSFCLTQHTFLSQTLSTRDEEHINCQPNKMCRTTLLRSKWRSHIYDLF